MLNCFCRIKPIQSFRENWIRNQFLVDWTSAKSFIYSLIFMALFYICCQLFQFATESLLRFVYTQCLNAQVSLFELYMHRSEESWESVLSLRVHHSSFSSSQKVSGHLFDCSGNFIEGSPIYLTSYCTNVLTSVSTFDTLECTFISKVNSESHITTPDKLWIYCTTRHPNPIHWNPS